MSPCSEEGPGVPEPEEEGRRGPESRRPPWVSAGRGGDVEGEGAGGSNTDRSIRTEGALPSRVAGRLCPLRTRRICSTRPAGTETAHGVAAQSGRPVASSTWAPDGSLTTVTIREGASTPGGGGNGRGGWGGIDDEGGGGEGRWTITTPTTISATRATSRSKTLTTQRERAGAGAGCRGTDGGTGRRA